MVRGDLSEAIFYKDTNAVHEAPPSWPKSPPKASAPKTIMLSVSILTQELGGGTQTLRAQQFSPGMGQGEVFQLLIAAPQVPWTQWVKRWVNTVKAISLLPSLCKSGIQPEHSGGGLLLFHNVWGVSGELWGPWVTQMAGNWNGLELSSLPCLVPGLTWRLDSSANVNRYIFLGSLPVMWTSSSHGVLSVLRFLIWWLVAPRTSVFSRTRRSGTAFCHWALGIT